MNELMYATALSQGKFLAFLAFMAIGFSFVLCCSWFLGWVKKGALAIGALSIASAIIVAIFTLEMFEGLPRLMLFGVVLGWATGLAYAVGVERFGLLSDEEQLEESFRIAQEKGHIEHVTPRPGAHKGTIHL